MIASVFLVLAGLAGVVAVLGWMTAAVHALLLLGHVAPPHTVGSLLFQGFRFFQAATFLPSGHPLRRRLLLGAAIFAAAVMGGGLLGMIGTALGR